MRNWNEKPAIFPADFFARFYSTYEELKPISSKYNSLHSKSFYSTYEELKLWKMFK